MVEGERFSSAAIRRIENLCVFMAAIAYRSSWVIWEYIGSRLLGGGRENDSMERTTLSRWRHLVSEFALANSGFRQTPLRGAAEAKDVRWPMLHRWWRRRGSGRALGYRNKCLAVSLVSVEPIAPPEASSDAVPGTLWFIFDVSNSSDASIALPGRPRPPEVLDPDGVSLQVDSVGVSLRNGGGGFGPASRGLGDRYLDPGGVMRVIVAVGNASADQAGRPLTVRYAPFLRYGAEFVVRQAPSRHRASASSRLAARLSHTDGDMRAEGNTFDGQAACAATGPTRGARGRGTD